MRDFFYSVQNMNVSWVPFLTSEMILFAWLLHKNTLKIFVPTLQKIHQIHNFPGSFTHIERCNLKLRQQVPGLSLLGSVHWVWRTRSRRVLQIFQKKFRCPEYHRPKYFMVFTENISWPLISILVSYLRLTCSSISG